MSKIRNKCPSLGWSYIGLTICASVLAQDIPKIQQQIEALKLTTDPFLQDEENDELERLEALAKLCLVWEQTFNKNNRIF